MKMKKSSLPIMVLLAICWQVLLPVGVEGRRRRRGRSHVQRLFVSLEKQNTLADRHGLERFDDLGQIWQAVERRRLVPLTDTDCYYLDPAIGLQDRANAHLYRLTRPWVKAFLDEFLAPGCRLEWMTGRRFRISSLVRTAIYQQHLRYRLRVAAPAQGAHRSAHLTGAVVDISYNGLEWQMTAWLRQRLRAYVKSGLIEALDERAKGGCFHVMVLPTFDRGVGNDQPPWLKSVDQCQCR